MNVGKNRYGAGKRQYNQIEKVVYVNLIRAYKQCVFASKRGDRSITRSRAEYMAQMRRRKPKVFAGFVDTVLRIRRDLKEERNG